MGLAAVTALGQRVLRLDGPGSAFATVEVRVADIIDARMRASSAPGTRPESGRSELRTRPPTVGSQRQ